MLNDRDSDPHMSTVQPDLLSFKFVMGARLQLVYVSKRMFSSNILFPKFSVPTASPSCGGVVAVYAFDINQPSLLTPFYSILVSVSVFTALSTVFHSINSPDTNSSLSHSVLPVLFLPHWSFQLYISLSKSPSACG